MISVVGSWELLTLKPDDKQRPIAVCIPHQGHVSMEWAMGFKKLQLPEHHGILLNKNFPISISRDNMVQSALDQNASDIIFIDSDTVPPPDGITRLVSYNTDIISGLYYAKKHYIKDGLVLPAAWLRVKDDSEDNQYAHVDPKANKGIVQVDVVGMGFCRIKVDTIFKKIKRPWFVWGKDGWVDGKPLPPSQQISEDFWLCERIKNELGLPIYVDMSIKCAHCFDGVITEEGKVELSRF